MALQKQLVRMSVQGGLDTKTDERNVLATNFLELENLVATKTGSFSKRNGYKEYVNTISGSTSKIASGQALAVFKNELLRFSDNNVYSYSQSQDTWASKGSAKFALASTYSVTSNGDKLTYTSHDTIQNLTCYAYTRNNGSSSYIEYRIIDTPTGSVLATNKFALGSYPTVVAIEGKFLIFYVSSGSLYVNSVSFSTPSIVSSAVAVLSSGYYSAARIGNRAYVVGADATTGIVVGYVTSGLTVIPPISVADTETFSSFSISAEQTTSVRVVYGHFANKAVKTVLLAKDLNYQIHAPVTLQASPYSASSVAAIQDPSNANQSQIYYSNVTSPVSLMKAVVKSDGTIVSNGLFLACASLQSRPQVYNGKAYLAVAYRNNYSVAKPLRTHFMVSESGDFITKFGEDTAVFAEGLSGPANLNIEGNLLTYTAAEAAEVQPIGASSVQVPTLVKKYTVDFTQSNNYFDSTLGDNMHISGGILKMYDGNQVYEHGFLQTPEAPQLVSESTLGGILVNGTWFYKLVYKWVDKWGQVHRSAASPILTYTVGATAKVPSIRLLTLAFTNKSDVELEIYRTTNAGTVFYKHGIVYADRVLNNKTVEAVTFADTTDDSTLQAGELLYSSGGVLENFSAPSSTNIWTYKGRLFLILSDGYTLQYSKKREQRSPVEFALELQINLDAYGGRAVAGAVMDDHSIIFKENAIFALTGEGPNALGEQDDFREPYLITSDVGCVDANSVVVTPEGLIFKSSKGLYLLSRNFTVQYIGAPVEAYNDLSITASNLIPNTNEVRFTTSGDKTLVYDYYHKFWLTFTNISAIDAVVYNNLFTFLRANGQLRQETLGSYSDAGSYIQTKMTSSWIQLQMSNAGAVSGGIQGYQRFYKMLILGSFKTKHGLKVKFAYDFNPSWAQEATIDAGEVLAPTAYGDGVYGSDVYGGSFPLYQFRIFPQRQKCEAFKFSIVDFQTTGFGDAFTLSNFAAEVGLKPTANKMGSANSFKAT